MKRIATRPKQDQDSAPRFKVYQQRLALVMEAMVFGLLIAELILRLIAPTMRLPFQVNAFLEQERGKFCQYDASLGWAGRPNVDEEFVCVDCSHRVRQNHYGYRGTAYPLQRSPRNRLLVLGDSFVWGYGVEEEEIFTTRVEHDAKTPVEMVNLGVSGYGTDQEVLLYRQLGKQFCADQVLLVVTPYTDLWDNMFPERYGYPKPLFRMYRYGDAARLELTNVPVPRRNEPWADVSLKVDSSVPWLCRMAAGSSVVALMINVVAESPSARAWLESKSIIPAPQRGYEWESWAHLSSIPADLEKSCDVLFALMGELKAEVNRNGSELAILLVPSAIDVDPKLWEDFKSHNGLPADVTWDRDQIRRRVVTFCRQTGIELIDPTDALRQAAEHNHDLYFRWNRHWTPAGHKIVAQLLLQQLSVTPSPQRVKSH